MNACSPRVSICIPNLNMRPFLAERMQSLLSQTFSDWELIVCDSYSTDGSWEFLQSYRGDPRIRLFQVPREGVFAGWNECLRRVRGEFIWIATSDDTADPAFLEQLLAPLEQLPEVDIAVCDFQAIDARSIPVDLGIGRQKRIFFAEYLNAHGIWDGKAQFLLHLAFGTTWTTMAAVLFRRRLLDGVGLFRTDMEGMGDYDWSLRASLLSSSAYVPRKLVTWRIHDGQCTGLRPMTIGESRAIMRSIQLICNESRHGFPEEWKQVPNWQELLLSKALWDYYGAYQLYRGVLKTNVRAFVGRVFLALCNEPSLLLRQCANAFKWSEQFSPDPIAAADRLLTAFKPQWPPRIVPPGLWKCP